MYWYVMYQAICLIALLPVLEPADEPSVPVPVWRAVCMDPMNSQMSSTTTEAKCLKVVLF